MKLKPLSKKGQLNSLAPAILALVFAAIVLVFGLVITESLVNTQVTGAAACNATVKSACDVAWTAGNQTVGGLGTFADFWEIIVLAIVIAIVIGLLLVVFGGRAKR